MKKSILQDLGLWNFYLTVQTQHKTMTDGWHMSGACAV